MARELTTPEPRAAIASQQIVNIEFVIPTKFDEFGSPSIDAQNAYVVFTIHNYDADGNRVGVFRQSGMAPDWPAAFKTDVSGVYSKLEAWAETLGLMFPGTSDTL